MLTFTANAEEGNNAPLSFQRSWYDATRIQWQPFTDGEGRNVDISYWKPAFTFPVNHSNTFEHKGKLYSGYNPFCRYSLGGTFEEQFSIGGISDVWKSTSDGKYCYMIEYEQPGIKVVDMESRKVVTAISTKNMLYWLRYVPSLDGGKGGFLAGDRTRMFKLAMDGTQIGDEIDLTPVISEECVGQDVAVAGGKAYLLVDGNTHSRKVYEFNLDNLSATGKTFDLHDFVGTNGVEEAFYPRTVMQYKTPQNREYLMFVDYSGVSFNATSIVVDSIPLKAGLDGYNIYRDGFIRNKGLVNAQAFSYDDSEMQQGTEYKYEVRPVVNGKEEAAIATGATTLGDTHKLPLYEDFRDYANPLGSAVSRLDKSYFEITDAGDAPAWTVRSDGDNSFIQYYRDNDKNGKQTLLSRPLHAEKDGTVKIEFSYSGNTYISGLDKETMNVEIQTEGGTEWKTVGSVAYKAQSGSFTTADFDVTEYVKDKNFRVRLRAAGAEDAPQTYSWQISGVKVWQYSPVNVSGKITVAGKEISKAVNIDATLKGVGTEYSAKTDDNGNFSFGNMQSGDYSLRVSGDGTVAEKDFTFGSSDKQYAVDIDGGVFYTESKGVDEKLGTNGKKSLEIPFTNSGNEKAVKELSYVPSDVDASNCGNSDIEGKEEWKLAKDIEASLPTLYDPLFYFNGKMYQKSNSYQNIELNEIDETGKVIATKPLAFETDGLSFSVNRFVSSGKQLFLCTQPQLYSTPALPMYIMPVDMAKGKILDSKKVAVDGNVSYVNAVGYNPKDSCLYVADYNNVYRLDNNGNITDTYSLPEAGYGSFDFDTYSAGGPYIWLAKQNYSPVGVVLAKYSVKDGKVVSTFDVNSMPNSVFTQGSNSMYSVSAYSVQTSTEVVPGYLSLLVTQNYNTRMGKSGSQMFVFRQFPTEKWISLDNDCETVDANGNGTIKLNLDATGLKNGEKKTASIILSSGNLADNVVIPVSLEANSSLDSEYPAANISAKVTDDFNVDLAWSSEAKHVKQYDIYRNGIKIASKDAAGFSDVSPLYGEQKYMVNTIYDNGTETASNTVTVDVANPQWAMPVENLTAENSNGKVTLSWKKSAGYRNGVFTDFEDEQPFSLDGPKGWTTIDGDNSYTFTSETLDFDNEGERMAGIIYAPFSTVPVDESFTDPDNKQVYMFVSSNIKQLRNNDWLISPELKCNGPVATDFSLRVASTSYGNEKLLVKYSLAGNAPEDFIPASDTINTISKDWQNYHFEMPAGTKYIALNYVSMYAYKLYLDNLYAGASGQYSPLAGINVYRDGIKLNDTYMHGNGFIDNDVASGKHTYEVENVYANGASGKATAVVTVGTDGISTSGSTGDMKVDNGILYISGGFDRLAVYTAGGKEVMSEGKTYSDFQMPLSKLSHGVYIIKITKNGTTQVLKTMN